MKEVFEKIIKKLQSEVERWEDSGKQYNDRCEIAVARGLRNAIEIVKQAAEKIDTDTNVGSNGWIPCSSGRLPEENTDVEVTIEEIADNVGGKRYYNVRSWLQDGHWVIKKNPYNPTVIAWKYPTAPYQPKGE